MRFAVLIVVVAVVIVAAIAAAAAAVVVAGVDRESGAIDLAERETELNYYSPELISDSVLHDGERAPRCASW